MAEELTKEKEAKLKVESKISKIISAICPDYYTDTEDMGKVLEVKKLLKEGNFWQAVDKVPAIAAESHSLTYDSTSETLEPVYFWIVDYMNAFFGGDVKKIIDNFSSSPGSGHFAELGSRATRMQEEGAKILGQVNVVIKSVMNLIYDLKEFEIRLSHYKSANSKNKEEAEAGVLALKQIWMDNVDVKRGRGSINMMAQDLNFVTLRDAFMIASSVEEVEKMDLNDRVKRILKPRLKEFFEWRNRSEIEMNKRFEIEKSYLKSQVASLRLYTRWAKPYLVAAERMRMQDRGMDPAMVNIFNTLVLQLTLFAKSEVKIGALAFEKKVPIEFGKRKFKRKYYHCTLVDFVFRGIPQRVSGQQAHYAFGGRTEVSFKGYCLNEDELSLFEDALKASDIEDALKLVESITDESLEQIRSDIEYFLKSDEEKAKEEKEKQKKSSDTNPFSALFGFYDFKSLGKPKTKVTIKSLKKNPITKDDYAEKLIRSIGEAQAREASYGVFDTYKKAHGMPSHPTPEDFG